MSDNEKLSCIYIYYRHVNSEKQLNKSRPEWFTYERAFLNLINSIIASDSQVKIDITIILMATKRVLSLILLAITSRRIVILVKNFH